MKKCLKCLEEKPIESFYTHSRMKDGHLNICSDCTKKRINQHRGINLDKIRRYDRLRGRTEKRLSLNRERAKKLRKEYSINGLKWKERNPEKRAAHILLRTALKSKRVTKMPCKVCGQLKVEAHHDDYSKPLEVVWLCKKHHCEIHRKYKDDD